MDVKLPDGTILKDVPEGTTKADLIAKLKSNGYDTTKLETSTSKDEYKSASPIQDTIFGGLESIGRGAKALGKNH